MTLCIAIWYFTQALWQLLLGALYQNIYKYINLRNCIITIKVFEEQIRHQLGFTTMSEITYYWHARQILSFKFALIFFALLSPGKKESVAPIPSKFYSCIIALIIFWIKFLINIAVFAEDNVSSDLSTICLRFQCFEPIKCQCCPRGRDKKIPKSQTVKAKKTVQKLGKDFNYSKLFKKLHSVFLYK